MNLNVPRDAAILLDFVGDIETDVKGAASYDVVHGHKKGLLKSRSHR